MKKDKQNDLNKIQKSKIALKHLKISVFDKQEIREKGKMIQCIDCGELFKTYETWTEYGTGFLNCCKKCQKIRDEKK